MIEPIVDRVLRSARYRDVDARSSIGSPPRSCRSPGTPMTPSKRVKRRLHQAVGAYRGARRADPLAAVRGAWAATWRTPRSAPPAWRSCAATRPRTSASRTSTDFFASIWGLTDGPPRTLLDLGCGLGPLAVPWMALPRASTYHACDVDRRSLQVAGEFLELVGQPHEAHARDVVADGPPPVRTDVVLMLKLVPLLDRQDPAAAARMLRAVETRHAVVSFPARSLGGGRRGMAATYRGRLGDLVAELGAPTYARHRSRTSSCSC
jgi:16S rRNA (guanine(1405)-N(7))-methyltransferase